MYRRCLLQRLVATVSMLGMLGACLGHAQETTSGSSTNAVPKEQKMESIVLGGGCFWCVEAVFLRVEGVSKVVSGYMGGAKPNPTYQEVCTGLTGHAEVIEVTFDPEVVSLEQILVIFFKTHDPTTLNRQGADVGTQYRSVVFYDGDAQKEATESVIKKLTEEKVYRGKIVTEVSPIQKFYTAENYHQNYYAQNPQNPYCQSVVASKVRKFEQLFKEYSINNKKGVRSKE